MGFDLLVYIVTCCYIFRAIEFIHERQYPGDNHAWSVQLLYRVRIIYINVIIYHKRVVIGVLLRGTGDHLLIVATILRRMLLRIGGVSAHSNSDPLAGRESISYEEAYR